MHVPLRAMVAIFSYIPISPLYLHDNQQVNPNIVQYCVDMSKDFLRAKIHLNG